MKHIITSVAQRLQTAGKNGTLTTSERTKALKEFAVSPLGKKLQVRLQYQGRTTTGPLKRYVATSMPKAEVLKALKSLKPAPQKREGSESGHVFEYKAGYFLSVQATKTNGEPSTIIWMWGAGEY